MPQTLVNALVSAALLAALGVGFGLIHRSGRFFHLGHGATFAVGAFAAWTFHRAAGLPQAVAFPLAVVAGGLLGGAFWYCVYRPIRRAGGGPLPLLIGGLGADLVIRNVLSLIYGDATLQVRSPWWDTTTTFVGARVSMAQLGLVATCAVALLVVSAVLRFTRWGREIRAVGDSPALAAAVGIDAERVQALTLVAGSVIAAAAGVFAALDTDLRPRMGMEAALLAIAASVVGGTGSLLGLVIAALGLAGMQQAGAWLLPVRWAEPLALVVLVAALCLRPRGLWSKNERLE